VGSCLHNLKFDLTLKEPAYDRVIKLHVYCEQGLFCAKSSFMSLKHMSTSDRAGALFHVGGVRARKLGTSVER